jgi:hypothetical protein
VVSARIASLLSALAIVGEVDQLEKFLETFLENEGEKAG